MSEPFMEIPDELETALNAVLGPESDPPSADTAAAPADRPATSNPSLDGDGLEDSKQKEPATATATATATAILGY